MSTSTGKRYRTINGTSVRDRIYEAIIANITAIANGWNSAPVTPPRKNTGVNTTQIASVETNAGTAISSAPSRMACINDLPIARLRWMLSIVTVASSTSMPTASAKPPSVITLMLCPSAARHMIDTRMDNGMDVATTNVLRQLPRKSRIIAAVRSAAMIASRSTPRSDARTYSDSSSIRLSETPSGSAAFTAGSAALMRATTSRVEALPFLRTLWYTPRCPFSRTRLVCTA